MDAERWGHATSPDAEMWEGQHTTREAAIADGKATYAYNNGHDEFWVRSGHLVSLEEVLPSADDIVDLMAERAGEIAGEAAEDYPTITGEALAELDNLLEAWGAKHAIPEFWVADGEPECIPAEP